MNPLFNPNDFKIRASAGNLILKDGKPPGSLGQTGKTYLQEWAVHQIYGIEKTVKSKYMDNGNINEPAALAYASEMLGEALPLIQNQERKIDEYFAGTCDADGGDYIADTKCVYSPYTFPLFPQTLEDWEGTDGPYFIQGQIYMHLWGKKHYKLCYGLMDLPYELVQRELRAAARDKGITPEMDEWALLQIETTQKYTYSVNKNGDPRPDSLRFRCFEFDYDPAVIMRLQKRVILCREYLAELASEKNAFPPPAPVPIISDLF